MFYEHWLDRCLGPRNDTSRAIRCRLLAKDLCLARGWTCADLSSAAMYIVEVRPAQCHLVRGALCIRDAKKKLNKSVDLVILPPRVFTTCQTRGYMSAWRHSELSFGDGTLYGFTPYYPDKPIRVPESIRRIFAAAKAVRTVPSVVSGGSQGSVLALPKRKLCSICLETGHNKRTCRKLDQIDGLDTLASASK